MSAEDEDIATFRILALGTCPVKLKITQESAASAAHLDAKHWQELEAGRVNPTLATLLAVARTFGVKLSELFDGV